MSHFGPGIKIAAYLAAALSFVGMATSAAVNSWWLFAFCLLVVVLAVQVVARIWATERAAVIRTLPSPRDWSELVANLEETAQQVTQRTL